MLQHIAWWISAAGIAVLAVIFTAIVLRSGQRRDYASIQAGGYRWRGRVFLALLALGVPLTGGTLVGLPYAAATQQTADILRVDAIGRQWYWQMSASEARAGQAVEFRVTSADVNHGLGIYDDSMRLVAQTQAMPGYVNRLVHTFERPGTYRILCLELCGAAHHRMEAIFTVTENSEQPEAEQ